LIGPDCTLLDEVRVCYTGVDCNRVLDYTRCDKTRLDYTAL